MEDPGKDGKRSSSAGSEKMERVGGRQEKMEGHCSTGQSPQWAVVPVEEEEEDYHDDDDDDLVHSYQVCTSCF